MHRLPGRPLVAGRWRRVLPRRLWAFTATRWLPRSPLSSRPGRCRAFCYSHAPLIIQVTAMTNCFTTRHSTRVRQPSRADEGWVVRHDLRYTGLTWLADAGVPVHVLSNMYSIRLGRGGLVL